MSQLAAGSSGASVPRWTVGDRLRKARELTGLKQEEFGAEIGISRRSISSYEGGDKAPRRPVLLAWSMKTGVDMDWIVVGDPSDGGGLPHLDSNQEPAGNSRRPALTLLRGGRQKQHSTPPQLRAI